VTRIAIVGGGLGVLGGRAVQLDFGWEFRRWQDGTVLSAQDLTAKSGQNYGEHTYAVHRADLLDAVRRAVPADAVKLGRRLDRFSVSAAVSLSFADGERAEADVVIGADGIHSVIRAALTEPAPPAHSGMCAFRALVPAAAAAEFARRPARVVWLGPGHHVVHYPVSGGELVNVSHARADYYHLPDGPERARDKALQAADPLGANEWIYAHDPFSPD
jgi:salicylate hydroxylase